MSVLDVLAEDRVLVVVRAPEIPDARELADAVVAGGIRVVELTFTTPDLARHLARAAGSDAVVGAGTVLGADQARTALDAGARFLVTPGTGPEAAEIVALGHAADASVILGALTPSEVMTAVALGADAVKIFPAHQFGPRYLQDLHGPFPDVPLVPSGGVNLANARDFLEAGALAVSAGSEVVAAGDVANSAWATITAHAEKFRTALS